MPILRAISSGSALQRGQHAMTGRLVSIRSRFLGSTILVLVPLIGSFAIYLPAKYERDTVAAHGQVARRIAEVVALGGDHDHVADIADRVLSDDRVREIGRFRLVVLIGAAGAMAVGVGLALLLSVRIGAPIRQLERAADRVARGDRDVMIDCRGHDEITDLARAFNAMVARIRDETRERETASALLGAARDQALAGARAKADFLAAMSHEIRTPMNGVVGMLGLLSSTPLSAKQQQFVQTAAGSADALLTIIDEILDFSKIEAGKLDLERVEFDPGSVVEDVAQLLAVKAHQQGLEIGSLVPRDLPSRVIGDPGRFRQVLLNLGGNAVKFTAVGEVWIRALTQRITDQSATLRFEVSDTGTGITPEAQARLFRPFSQADSSTTRRFGGTGLGLSIARRLVELMGGAIGVESTEGQGSTFWFEIEVPLAGARMAVAAPPAASTAVLVVDDNPAAREALRHYLAAPGRTVYLAATTDEARRILEAPGTRPPGIVLVDETLPGNDGPAFGTWLRGVPRFAAVRTILLASTTSGIRNDQRVKALWYDDVVAKPVRRDFMREGFEKTATVSHSGFEAPEPTTGDEAASDQIELYRILLVEDHPVNRMLALEILSGGRFHVDVATNGAEAVEARFRAAYDLVLMDCQMPVMDGYEASRAIRDREAARGDGSRVPIIALTANALEGDMEACLASGMDDYLSKPFTPAGLTATLRRHLKGGGGAPRIETGPRPSGSSLPSAGADPFDLSRLRDMIGDDEADIRHYLAVFANQTAASLSELADARLARNSDQVHRVAHKIRGSSAMIGAGSLARVAGAIEGHVGCSDTAELDSLLRELDTEFRSARAFAIRY